MPTVKIEPTDEYPVPYDTSEEELDNFADKLASAANTAELLVELGAPVEVDPATLAEENAEEAASPDQIELSEIFRSELGKGFLLELHGGFVNFCVQV